MGVKTWAHGMLSHYGCLAPSLLNFFFLALTKEYEGTPYFGHLSCMPVVYVICYLKLSLFYMLSPVFAFPIVPGVPLARVKSYRA